MPKPPMQPSDEATGDQLDLARKQGEAYQEALAYMVDKVVDAGGSREADDYLIAFAQEEAEGMYHLDDQGELTWLEPGDENCHLEIAVCDRSDKRFIPGLDVEVTIEGEDGARIGPMAMPFLWHPGLYHYGRNLKLPGDGRYTIRVRVKAPTFHRHDRANGRRYGRDVEIAFEGVALKTGRE